MFLAPNFLGGALPEFLESIYKIDTGFDHVAKFRGDRPRELGDYALKKIKHHEHFISSLVTTYGRPNYELVRACIVKRDARVAPPTLICTGTYNVPQSSPRL